MNQVGAFFDIDHTVLEINSGTKWIGYQWKSGGLTPWQLAQAVAWVVQYRFGWLDYDAMARKVLARYRGGQAHGGHVGSRTGHPGAETQVQVGPGG